jgi:hypothetical protein
LSANTLAIVNVAVCLMVASAQLAKPMNQTSQENEGDIEKEMTNIIGLFRFLNVWIDGLLRCVPHEPYE